MLAKSKPVCHVFDIDDTLYLERDYVRSGFDAVGEHLCKERRTRDFSKVAWALFEAGIRGNTFDLALKSLGLPHSPADIDRLIRVYREHAPNIEMLPDARTAVEQAQAQGPLAFITDGPLVSQTAKAKALGLHVLDALLIYTAEYGEGFGKPNPRAFVAVEERFGSAYKYVYYADNPAKDFITPRKRQWMTVRMRRPGGLHAAIPSDYDVDLEQTTALQLWVP